jgi:hypothetical protein
MRHFPSTFFLLGALAVIPALQGCSTGSGESRGKLSCPATFVAPSLDTYRQFRPSGTTTPEDIQFGVRLASVRSTCHAEDQGIRVDTRVVFQVARNDPDFRQGDFTYFVAVADPTQTILTKRIFALRVDFEPRQNQMRIVDEVTERLPLRDRSAGRSYAIIVGLQLSKQQLDLNRGENPAQ